MALVYFAEGVSCLVRPGDVVIHYHNPDNRRRFPFHVCIHIGTPSGSTQEATGPSPRLKIRGLPESRVEEDLLGDSWTGDKGSWYANMVGMRLDADDIELKNVVMLSEATMREQSQLGRRCEWQEKMLLDPSRPILGEHPRFLGGTCAHFVEYLYEEAGLDLVNQDRVRFPEPEDADRLPPGAQVHAFYTGTYPLDCDWDERFRRYPDCTFGALSLTK